MDRLPMGETVYDKIIDVSDQAFRDINSKGITKLPHINKLLAFLKKADKEMGIYGCISEDLINIHQCNGIITLIIKIKVSQFYRVHKLTDPIKPARRAINEINKYIRKDR